MKIWAGGFVDVFFAQYFKLTLLSSRNVKPVWYTIMIAIVFFQVAKMLFITLNLVSFFQDGSLRVTEEIYAVLMTMAKCLYSK